MKIIYSIVWVMFLIPSLKADQLQWVTLNQAKETAEFLATQEQVILWCACCDGEAKELVGVVSVTYELVAGSPNMTEEFYQVLLNGVTLDGETFTEAIDLAYVHVNVNGLAFPLAVTLGYECDPCTEPFAWF